MTAARRDIVVFDVGAVLIEWDPRHLYRKLIPDADALERFLAHVCTPQWNVSQDAGRSWEEAETEAISRHPDKAELIRAYRARWHEMVPGPIGGTVAILEELADAGTPLHAITNFAADTFAETRRRFGFFQRFQSIVVSGEIGITKPDARIFRHLAEQQRIDLARAVLIDDSAANCAAARDLGMGVVHFKEPGQTRRELIAHGFALRPVA
jgi:2-haloacid dehalogenase